MRGLQRIHGMDAKITECAQCAGLREARNCGKRGIAGIAALSKNAKKGSQKALKKLSKGSQKLSKSSQQGSQKSILSFFDACVDHFGSFWTLASSFLGAKSSQKLRNARNVRDCGKRGIAGSAELRELLRSPKTLRGALKKLSRSSQRALRKLWKGSQKLSKSSQKGSQKSMLRFLTLASSFLGASGRFRRAF